MSSEAVRLCDGMMWKLLPLESAEDWWWWCEEAREESSTLGKGCKSERPEVSAGAGGVRARFSGDAWNDWN